MKLTLVFLAGVTLILATHHTRRMGTEEQTLGERGRAMTYQCSECGSWWPSRTARDECAILDAVEARDARRPNPKTMRPITRWDND